MQVRNTILAAMLVCLLCSALSAQQCSIHALRGTWAFSEFGWTVPLESGASAASSPVTGIGVMTIDFRGNLQGSGSFISGTGIPGTPIPAGQVLDFDFEGTVELSPECTGYWRFNFKPKGSPSPIPGEFIERIIYSHREDRIYSLSVRSPLSKPLWVGYVTRLSGFHLPLSWPAIPE
jgi:hypothetical protein